MITKHPFDHVMIRTFFLDALRIQQNVGAKKYVLRRLVRGFPTVLFP